MSLKCPLKTAICVLYILHCGQDFATGKNFSFNQCHTKSFAFFSRESYFMKAIENFFPVFGSRTFQLLAQEFKNFSRKNGIQGLFKDFPSTSRTFQYCANRD